MAGPSPIETAKSVNRWRPCANPQITGLTIDGAATSARQHDRGETVDPEKLVQRHGDRAERTRDNEPQNGRKPQGPGVKHRNRRQRPLADEPGHVSGYGDLDTDERKADEPDHGHEDATSP